MALPYQPRLGSIVLCDFRGMIEPEMVKRREVVVIARHKRNSQLVTVVPLSSTEPERIEMYHHKLSNKSRPDGDPTKTIWAKCDMVYTLCLERLDMHYTSTRRGGRQSVRMKLSHDDLAAIRSCVALALELGHNTAVPVRDFESGSVTTLNQPETA
jgi:uncharacterized protein YifN (PemK superfamily)